MRNDGTCASEQLMNRCQSCEGNLKKHSQNGAISKSQSSSEMRDQPCPSFIFEVAVSLGGGDQRVYGCEGSTKGCHRDCGGWTLHEQVGDEMVESKVSWGIVNPVTCYQQRHQDIRFLILKSSAAGS